MKQAISGVFVLVCALVSLLLFIRGAWLLVGLDMRGAVLAIFALFFTVFAIGLIPPDKEKKG